MNDLDQLKELLFGAEKEALDSIAERVERREVRTVDVADILPEAIYQSHKKDGELVESLTEPVGECLQQAFRDDPETYSDALYPVMGPAIRKSITHALRNFSQQINEAVEHSFSPKGLKWRVQAARAGVPFGEFVLQKTMRYRVEQAYLISRENGLLVDHVHHAASKIKDSDAVSAMFTAIQDFVKESFSPDRTGRLESADMGEFTLWAVHGPHALLVCVIRGVPPKSLRADLTAVLERIHFRYGEAIREYRGDTSSVPKVREELERCLRFEARDEGDESRGRFPRWLIVGLLLLVAAGLFLGVRSWTYAQEYKKFDAALNATPGIYVTELERDGKDFTVRGLRDPLAISVTDIAEGVDIPVDRVSASMQPFQSLQPEILEARVARMFGRPDSVTFSISDATLQVTGDAPWLWRRQLQSRFNNLPGVELLDLSRLMSSDRLQFTERVASLDAKQFYFEEGIEFIAGNESQLREHAAALRALLDEAAEFDYSISVAVAGSTDAWGEPAVNSVLAQNRARLAANILSLSGVDARVSGRSHDVVEAEQTGPDFSKRYVRVDLKLDSMPGQP